MITDHAGWSLNTGKFTDKVLILKNFNHMAQFVYL